MLVQDDASWPLLELAYIRDGPTYARYGPWSSVCLHLGEQQKALQRSEAAQITRYLSILGVCRQMYCEARLLPFERHTFEFNSHRLFRFITGLDGWQRNAVRNLKLEFRIHNGDIFLGSQRLDAAQLKAGVKSLCRLRKVSISFSISKLSILSMQNRYRVRLELRDAAQRLERDVRDVLGGAVTWEVQHADWETRAEPSWPYPCRMKRENKK